MKKIQQHLYTRGRSGVFSSSPGYDTVAKSSGLDNQFIKKVLHPLCSYNPPRSLGGEKDESKYPNSVLVSFTESGELLLGQSVYKQSDYTGDRSTFFVHHYVISTERAQEFANSPEMLFGNLTFITNHDVAEDGKNLEELELLPVTKLNHAPPTEVLEKANITADEFKQLLYALLFSLVSKKKVYVTLDGDVKNAADLSRSLAYYLFKLTPPEMRKYFGFSSYQAEPQSKKNMGLIFVEKGSIRMTDSSFSKDFIFDFANGKSNVNENMEGHPYVEFAYNSLVNNEASLDSFYQFAKVALQDIPAVSLLLYNDLTQLYQLKEGDFRLYENNKSRTFSQFLSFIKPETIAHKQELYSLLIDLINYENHRTDKERPTVELTSQMAALYPYLKETDSIILARFFIKVLYFGSNDKAYMSSVFENVKMQMPLYKAIISDLCQQGKLKSAILDTYINDKFTRTVKLSDVIKELLFWMKQTPVVFQDLQLQDLVVKRVLEVAQQENKKIKIYLDVKKELKAVVSTDSSIQSLQKAIEQTLGELAVSSVELQNLTAEDFEIISSIVKHLPVKEGTVGQKAAIIETVNEILNSRQLREVEVEKFAKTEDLKTVQRLVLKLINTKDVYENVGKLAFSFFGSSSFDRTNYHYNNLLKFVHDRHGISKTREFLSHFSSSYLRDPSLHNKEFVSALENYILMHFEEIKRDKKEFRLWERNHHPTISTVMKKVVYKKKSPAARFLDKNAKLIIYSLMAICLGLALATGGAVLYYKLNDKKEEVTNPDKLKKKEETKKEETKKEETKKEKDLKKKEEQKSPVTPESSETITLPGGTDNTTPETNPGDTNN